MKKFLNRLAFWKKKHKSGMDFLSSIGYTYIQACKNDREFRRKMEKTQFGKAVKLHIETFRKQSEING